MNAKYRALLSTFLFGCTPAALLMPANSYASPLYSVTVIPNVWANGLNANGQVTGFTPPSGASSQAFIYTSGSIETLGTLGGTSSDGQGINSSGDVTGESDVTGNPFTGPSHAFLYSNGTMHDLGSLGGPNDYSNGNAVNDSGEVTGDTQTGTGDYAFLYSNGRMQNLGGLGGDFSGGTGINKSGEVAGYAELANGESRAFLYSNGTMHDLGTLGGPNSGAGSINDSGQVTGTSELSGGASEHAFLYSNGVMKDLGTLGGAYSFGLAINDGGEVTGESFTNGAGGQSSFDRGERAFVYSGGEMVDLNTWAEIGGGALTHDTLVEGIGINDNGQILVDGFVILKNWSIEEAAFLLTPIPQTNVPEPGTLGLLALGLTGLGLALRRRVRIQG